MALKLIQGKATLLKEVPVRAASPLFDKKRVPLG